MFGFHLISNLGKHLGVSLLHKRCKNSDFQFIFDRLSKKLNGWKGKFLLPARRVTLAKLALSTIPYYTMQTFLLPKSLCCKIDKVCRQFILGGLEARSKCHLVNWSKVYRPKEEGGLGFRKAREVNLACMMKLAWGLVVNPERLWVKVIRNKYGLGEDMIPNIRARVRISNADRGIITVWPVFKRNLIWRIGKGNQIKFWRDHWIPAVDRLADFATTDFDESHLNQKINEYALNGNWDWEKLKYVLPSDCLELLSPIKAPDQGTNKDMIAWFPNLEGVYTLKSAYKVWTDDEALTKRRLYKCMWNLVAPQRIKAFLWLVMNEALLTN